MQAFDFWLKTKILFGKGKEQEVGKEIRAFHGNKVLIVYGKHSVVASGLLNRVISYIQNENLSYVLLGGVEPNPKLSLVKKGIQIVNDENVDFILALGGGSVIDTAKLISVAYDYKGDPYDFNLKKVEADHALPLGVVLTISAAGSEMSTSCVISEENTHQKRGFNSEWNRPLFAILNPELTYTVSPYQTACGIVDIMMHTLERYFNPSSTIELSDDLALGLLKNVKKAGEEAMKDPASYEARSNLMLASSFSHNGLTGIGKKTIMPVHQLEHALSGYYDHVAHGAGLAVLFPYWAMLYYTYDIPKFARFAREVMDVEGNDDKQTAYLGIQAIQSFFRSLGMPSSIKELGISSFEIAPLLDLMFDSRDSIASVGHDLSRKEAKEIFTLCMKGEII